MILIKKIIEVDRKENGKMKPSLVLMSSQESDYWITILIGSNPGPYSTTMNFTS